MLTATIIMGVLAATLVVIGYSRGEGQHISGLRSGLNMIIGILPLLAFAFTIAGMVQVLLPQETVSRWVGVESGMRGILIGSIAGGFTPGGPYVSLPIVAGLIKTGASVGVVVAYITGWSLLAVGRLPMEVALLGWRFTVVRLVSTMIFPPIAGLIAQTFFAGFK